MQDNYLDYRAPIFNIQSYSIHDGPGIRVTVFEKGCPLRCRWCANPESNSAEPQLMTYSNKCTGCGMCISVCPEDAVVLGVKNGKYAALTDRNKCINCGTCVTSCPSEAREIAGHEMSVREVLNEVIRDKMFMDASGGGMTVSGGEPLFHADFTAALLHAAKEEGIHTAIESSGFASEKDIDLVYSYVDLGILDIKHMDSKRHEELTGVPNTQILKNICHIYHDLKKQIMISIPIIPGMNDTEDNIRKTAEFISGKLSVQVPVRLLPYHRLGESKSDSLGKCVDHAFCIPSDEEMEHLKQVIGEYGINVQIGG